MTSIPTDENLLKEIRAISKTAPHLMICANCIHYNKASGECPETRRTFVPYVRGCEGKYFVSDEEHMLAKVKKELTEQALDLDKIEALLALLITMATGASCFAEDLAKRIKIVRKMSCHADRKQDLRKDLDLVEDVDSALKRINKIADKIQKDLGDGLEKIDQQYRLYIERHLNRLFTTDGKFDVRKSDGNLNNALICCNVLGKFIKGCIGNKTNYDMVFAMLDNLHNDTPYPLDFKDFAHYNLKGYESEE
jgi:hypothetical protein